MFPVTITLSNADQLNAVLAALGNPAAKTVEAAPAKKSEPKPAPAATAPVATQPTVAATAAPEPKVETSAPASVAPANILDKDALTAAVKNAIAKAGRDPVVALISSYGAAKAGDVAADKRQAFDAALLALAA